MTRVLIFSLALGWVAGCASRSEHSTRAYVSEQLQGRAGQSVNPNGGTTEFSFPASVEPADGISETEAATIALWNSPAFQQTLSDLGISQADVLQAGLLANPTFSMLFPLGPKQLEFTATLPLQALWLRPRRLTMARLQAERVAHTLVQGGLDLIRDVRIGYTDLMLARDRARLAREGLEVRGNIQALSEARLRGGDLSELEATTARVDALRAKEEANRAEADARIAEEKLRSLVGLSERAERFEFKPADKTPALRSDLQELESTAFAARPDLRAAELGLEAAAKRAGLAKAEVFAISGVVDANASENGGLEVGPGVELPIPLFDRNQAGIARAKAEMERAAWNYVAVKQRIAQEVRDARARFQQAQESAQEWEQKIMPPLEEGAKQAEKAYELGDVSLLLVYESTRQLLSARVRQAEVAADLRRALAELERSVGRRLDAEAK